MSDYRLLENGTDKRLLETGTDLRVLQATTIYPTGLLRVTTRCLALSLSLVFFATPAKAIERLTSATLTSKVALTGTVRASERIQGATLRQALTIQSPSRIRQTERLLGATLAEQSTTTSVAGTCREHERLLGAMLGGKTALAGISRTNQRLLATGIALAYASAPIRKGERLLGATLSVPVGGTTALAGTIRATERLPGSMSLLPITTWSLQSPDGTAWVPTISIAGIVTWTSGGAVLTPIAPCFQGTPDTTVWTPQISNAGIVTIVDGPATGNYRAALLDSNLVTWLILVDSDGIVHLSPVGRLAVAGTIRTTERLTGADLSVPVGGFRGTVRVSPLVTIIPSFPTTGILDTFNRANEDPLANGTWAVLKTGVPALKLVSSAIQPSAQFGAGSYWTPSSFGPNAELYATVPTFDTISDLIDLALRTSGAGGSSISGYEANFERRASGVRVSISKHVTNTVTLLTDLVEVSSWALGDGIGFSARDSRLTAWVRLSGVWQAVVSVHDSTLTAAGHSAIRIYTSAGSTILDDVGGGTGSGGVLLSRLALAGTLRTVERLTGVLRSKVLLAGTCREIERVAGATLGGKGAFAGTLRTTERLPGSILGGKVALAGKLRATERLTGTLQFAGTTQALAGRSRSSQRLRATGISLAYSATPARAGVRLRGATSGILNLVTFSGVSRSGARLTGRLALVYDTAAIVQTERLRGATLGWKVYLTGTVRETERLSGRLQTSGTTASVQGTIRESERLTGATLRSKVALRGTLQGSSRLAGSILEGKVSLRGTARGTELLTGRLLFAGTTADLAGTIQQTALLQGDLRLRGPVTTFIEGTVRQSELLAGAILEGKVALLGTASGEARTIGSLSQTVLIAGTARGSERVRGAALIEAQPITVLTGVLRVSGLTSGAILIQRLPLRGTVREVERVRGARFHLPTFGYWYHGGYTIRGMRTRL